MLEIFNVVEKIRKSDVPVLIYGETGTGKELLADYIWGTGPRQAGHFVKVNCAAIPENLIESELFGHAKGSFTGASTHRTGLFEYAHNGTVFLDEIGDLNNSAQTKLLRFAQDGTFRKVGGNDLKKSNIRIIAATNRDLMKIGFRTDLYFRISVISVMIPALRQRPEDLTDLVQHFGEKFAGLLGIKYAGIVPVAMEKLRDYHWPGNVRELENVIRRAVLMADGGEIKAVDVFVGIPELEFAPAQAALYDLAENEKRLIRMAMKECNGVQKSAAKLLGITPRTINYKLKIHGMR